jgi:hypothetical protein
VAKIAGDLSFEGLDRYEGSKKKVEGNVWGYSRLGMAGSGTCG